MRDVLPCGVRKAPALTPLPPASGPDRGRYIDLYDDPRSEDLLPYGGPAGSGGHAVGVRDLASCDPHAASCRRTAGSGGTFPGAGTGPGFRPLVGVLRMLGGPGVRHSGQTGDECLARRVLRTVGPLCPCPPRPRSRRPNLFGSGASRPHGLIRRTSTAHQKSAGKIPDSRRLQQARAHESSGPITKGELRWAVSTGTYHSS